MMRPGVLAALATAAAISASLVSATAAAGLERPGEPVTLRGADLPRLAGADPSLVVAFAKRRRGWLQVPVQIDQRKLVDFGEPPGGVGAGGGSNGTVYGTTPSGIKAMQYADPGTFVGVDPDGGFDSDDELTFMAGDTGRLAGPKSGKPAGVSSRRATAVRVDDPLRPGSGPGWLYLFRSRGELDPAAGEDYVAYDFELRSGSYKPTYRRGTGPNPENSTITTRTYEAGFSDRWFYDELRLEPPVGNGADVLDGFKFGFGPGTCGRSEATFNSAEGAFAANIDGPVRAIRAYVGANSGPRTERTHFFYADRHEIVTDLRVHPVPGPLTFHDLSAAGIGMSFRSSVSRSPVRVDGSPDTVGTAAPEWGLWTGRQGALFSADRSTSSFGDELEAGGYSFYQDDSTPPNPQCWGDPQAYGQFGFGSSAAMPNTDPALGEADTLQARTTEIFAGPATGTGRASRWSQELDAPLAARAEAYEPG